MILFSFIVITISPLAYLTKLLSILFVKIFDYIDNDNTVFEKKTLEQLASEGELMSYLHKGFWQCMDNIRERNILEQLLANNVAPWVKWH